MKTIQYQIRGYTEIWNEATEQAEQSECVSTVKVACKTQEEFDAIYPAVEAAAIAGSVCVSDETDVPTQLDMIEAQLVYTAMMTDTLLEV